MFSATYYNLLFLLLCTFADHMCARNVRVCVNISQHHIRSLKLKLFIKTIILKLLHCCFVEFEVIWVYKLKESPSQTKKWSDAVDVIMWNRIL